MKATTLISTTLLLATSVGFAGSLTPMNNSQVTDALSDKTITTIAAADLNGKVISDSFTGFFSKDGKVTGKFANKPDNGPQADTGKWMVKSNGLLCLTWDHWFNAKEECVNFYKLKNAILIVNTDEEFESVILDKDIKASNQM